MEVKQSQRAHGIKISPLLAASKHAAELARAGRDIIDLTVSEPAADTPPHVTAAAIAAIERGQTRSTEVDGTPDLKAAIIAKFARDNGLHFAPTQVLVTNGCKQSLYNLMQALLNDDDEVIIPAPYWVSYPDLARLAGADPVIVRTRRKHGYKMTPEELRGALGPRSRLVILNSPCNPTGAVYSRAELAALGHVLEEFPEVVIVSDDLYEQLCWGTEPFANILNVMPRLHERTVVVNGLSQNFAMRGWRIGYAAGPTGLIAAMKKIQSHSTSHPCAIAQAAAVAALNGEQSFPRAQCTVLEARHALVLRELHQIPDLAVQPAQGTFYAFPDMSGVIARMDGIEDDLDLARLLLDTAGVAIMPGSAFGMPDCLRLSYTAADGTLIDALARIRRVLA